MELEVIDWVNKKGRHFLTVGKVFYETKKTLAVTSTWTVNDDLSYKRAVNLIPKSGINNRQKLSLPTSIWTPSDTLELLAKRDKETER